MGMLSNEDKNLNTPNAGHGAATSVLVGDNTASGLKAPSGMEALPPNPQAHPTGKELPKSPHDQDIHLGKALQELRDMATQTCQELKVIKSKLGKLDKIELTTDSLTERLSGVVQRTTALEGISSQHSDSISELKDEITSLKATVASQEETISELKHLKSDISKINSEFKNISQDKVQEFKNLIGIQQKQVDAFHETNKQIQDVIQENVTQHVDEKMGKMQENIDYKSLKDQAARNINNLVIVGLEEDNNSPLEAATEFVSSTLGIKDVRIDHAYRLGPPPREGSLYARPILMRFPFLPDRFKVWKRRTPITSEDGTRTIRIHQDLPKRLREDSQILHRVLRAATAHPKYRSAKVKDYKLIINGTEYGPEQLERLPKPIRPSTLSTRASDSVLVFFTRHSVLSNHHPAPFTFKNIRYANMEHYLAHQRALVSGDPDLIQRALHAADPLEAKSILNLLKRQQPQEWEDKVEKVLLQGLREKFGQNPRLLQYLKDTQHLTLGEASRDPKWAVGMSLEDEDVLDVSKWLPTGNLLGRTLTRVRTEFLQGVATDQPPNNLPITTRSSTVPDPGRVPDS